MKRFRINIEEKYIFLYKNGKQIGHFEHFTDRKDKLLLIKIHCENTCCTGDKFIRKNNGKLMNCDVIRFGKKINHMAVFYWGGDEFSPYHMLCLVNQLSGK